MKIINVHHTDGRTFTHRGPEISKVLAQDSFCPVLLVIETDGKQIYYPIAQLRFWDEKDVEENRTAIGETERL